MVLETDKAVDVSVFWSSGLWTLEVGAAISSATKKKGVVQCLGVTVTANHVPCFPQGDMVLCE
jgi:hypothetical protein